MTRPYVLSIAGFDPSGGAGIIADCKTFEANKVQGLAVLSANTFQHEQRFSGLEWISKELLVRQLELLFEKYSIEYVKIGLIESLPVMMEIVRFLKDKNDQIKIIWDPVLKASAGCVFHDSFQKENLENICSNIYLITPNWEEMQALYPGEDPKISAKSLAALCIVYLKGGHNTAHKGKDFLYEKSRECTFNPKTISAFDKHGTGCVFSAALTANLARGFHLRRASLRSKQYISHYLLSNKTLLGYHK